MFVQWYPLCSGAPDDFCTVLAQPHLRCGTVSAPKILSRSAILSKLEYEYEVAWKNPSHSLSGPSRGGGGGGEGSRRGRRSGTRKSFIQ